MGHYKSLIDFIILKDDINTNELHVCIYQSSFVLTSINNRNDMKLTLYNSLFLMRIHDHVEDTNPFSINQFFAITIIVHVFQNPEILDFSHPELCL